MTLPYERRNAVNTAREFLRSLLDPKQTPRIPLTIRKRARNVLKHYPSEFDMSRLPKDAKEVFGDKGDK